MTNYPNNRSSLVGKKVTELADAYMTSYFLNFPELATYHGIADAQHDKLTDNSLTGVQAWQSVEDSLYIRLQAIDENSLGGQPEWGTYKLFKSS